MAIPVFGYLKIEVAACLLLVVGGLAGAVIAMTGSLDSAAAANMGNAWPRWLVVHVRVLLVIQCLAIMAGGIGAWRSRSFVLAAIGIIACLIVVTPVGMISFWPGMFMLYLIMSRLRAFRVFLPRWKGPGPAPPGAWR